MSAPKPITSQEAYAAEREKNGDDPRAFALALLSAITGSGASQLPTYSSQDDVWRRANADFRRNDFSDAMDYLDSLVKIADHWQNLAETYHSTLTSVGAKFHDTGEVTGDFEPMTVTLAGEQVGGSASVYRLDNEDESKYALEELVRQLGTTTYEPTRQRLAELIAQWTPKDVTE